jgi:hypothetical protein
MKPVDPTSYILLVTAALCALLAWRIVAVGKRRKP